jgi:hypothetical protein
MPRSGVAKHGHVALLVPTVLPHWLASTLPDVGTGRPIIRTERPDRLRVWRVPFFSQTAKRVCDGCNSGWMSRLETTVQPILAPMISTKHNELHEEMQAVLATWLVKTIIMADCVATPSWIPTEQPPKILQRLCPMDDTGIWIACCSAGNPVTRYYPRPLMPKIDRFGPLHSDLVLPYPLRIDRFVGFAATLRIGGFVAQVDWSESIEHTDHVLKHFPPMGAQQIWPITNPVVFYPRGPALNLADLEELCRRFHPGAPITHFG